MLPLLQADTQHKALESKHTPNWQILQVNSTYRTTLKGWISVVVRQGRANCTSLGALYEFVQLCQEQARRCRSFVTGLLSRRVQIPRGLI